MAAAAAQLTAPTCRAPSLSHAGLHPPLAQRRAARQTRVSNKAQSTPKRHHPSGRGSWWKVWDQWGCRSGLAGGMGSRTVPLG